MSVQGQQATFIGLFDRAILKLVASGLTGRCLANPWNFMAGGELRLQQMVKPAEIRSVST
jgi:hypothetical protein